MENFPKMNVDQKIKKRMPVEDNEYRDNLAHELKEKRKISLEEASKQLKDLNDNSYYASYSEEKQRYNAIKDSRRIERNVIIDPEAVLNKIDCGACYDCTYRENTETMHSLLDHACSTENTFDEKYDRSAEVIEVMDSKDTTCNWSDRNSFRRTLVTRANRNLADSLEVSEDVQSYLNSELFKSDDNGRGGDYLVETLYKKDFASKYLKELIESEVMDFKKVGHRIQEFTKEGGTIFDIYENESERSARVRELLHPEVSESSRVEIFEWLLEHNLLQHVPSENLEDLKNSINKNHAIPLINHDRGFKNKINKIYYDSGGREGLEQLDSNGFGIIDSNIFFDGKFTFRLHDVARLSNQHTNGEVVAWSTYEVIDESRSRGAQIRRRIYGIKKGDAEPSMLFDENGWMLTNYINISDPIVKEDGTIEFTASRDGKEAEAIDLKL